MTTSIREALARATALLQASGIESARLDSRVLLSHALGVPSEGSIPAEIKPEQIENFDLLLARRAAREPVAYIVGRKEFWSFDFEVGSAVLVPRPETETLVEQALRSFPDAGAYLRVLDMGTGSGCLLIALLKERPNATGLGIDTLEPAIVCARRNAARHDVSRRCSFDVRDVLCVSSAEFDVILANPPYLTDEEFAISPQEIKEYEPRQALAAGRDGLAAMRAFVPAFERALSPGGMAFLEIGIGQAEKVAEIVVSAGLEVRVLVSDISGIPRCMVIGRAGEGCLWRP